MALQENGLKDETEMGERGWRDGCKRQCRKMARKTKSKQEKKVRDMDVFGTSNVLRDQWDGRDGCKGHCGKMG